MKAIMPKPFERLSQSEKNAIYRAVANLANEQTDKGGYPYEWIDSLEDLNGK